eukprot:8518922-Pyramimonas_sp.AAC.1
MRAGKARGGHGIRHASRRVFACGQVPQYREGGLAPLDAVSRSHKFACRPPFGSELLAACGAAVGLQAYFLTPRWYVDLFQPRRSEG